MTTISTATTITTTTTEFPSLLQPPLPQSVYNLHFLTFIIYQHHHNHHHHYSPLPPTDSFLTNITSFHRHHQRNHHYHHTTNVSPSLTHSIITTITITTNPTQQHKPISSPPNEPTLHHYLTYHQNSLLQKLPNPHHQSSPHPPSPPPFNSPSLHSTFPYHHQHHTINKESSPSSLTFPPTSPSPSVTLTTTPHPSPPPKHSLTTHSHAPLIPIHPDNSISFQSLLLPLSPSPGYPSPPFPRSWEE